MMKASDQGYRVSGLWNDIIGEMIPGGQSQHAASDLLILIMERTEEARAERERQ